jgi:FAD/FMN-containing dehydrogenase
MGNGKGDDMTSTVIPSTDQFRAEISGQVIQPGDPTYDEARVVFLGGVDSHPALIVRVANDDDVARVIRLARESGLPLAIRSGGHSSAAHSTVEGGIVLDLRDMKAIDLDAEGGTVWAEAGLTAQELTNALGDHGLVLGFGDTGSVGIGGITLGGGIGFLVRAYGMTIDDLLEADIVTARGERLRTGPNSHPDLFWAIRGGGGNFGVVTRFRYRVHRLPATVGGMLFLPATAETIAGFIAASESAPDELSTIANVMTAPPMPFLAEEHHGKTVIMAMMTYAGEGEAAERAIAPFRALATPLADLLKPMEYREMYPAEEPGAEDYHPLAAARTMFLDRVDPPVAQEILDRIDAHMVSSGAQMAAAQLRVLGGAMARVPADATAFAHRRSRIMANLAAIFERPEDASVHEQWVDDFVRAIRQTDEGAYVNFVGDEGEGGLNRAYPSATLERLAAIKSIYDPENLFRRNQNVAPATP